MSTAALAVRTHTNHSPSGCTLSGGIRSSSSSSGTASWTGTASVAKGVNNNKRNLIVPIHDSRTGSCALQFCIIHMLYRGTLGTLRLYYYGKGGCGGGGGGGVYGMRNACL